MTRVFGQVWHAVTGGMMTWYDAKMFIEHASVVSSDALHVLVGVLVWIAIAMLLRRPVSTWRPWLILLALALFNEAVDLWVERWPYRSMQYGESAKDIALTMFLPGVLLVLARARHPLFGPGTGSRRRSGGGVRRR